MDVGVAERAKAVLIIKTSMAMISMIFVETFIAIVYINVNAYVYMGERERMSRLGSRKDVKLQTTGKEYI